MYDDLSSDVKKQFESREYFSLKKLQELKDKISELPSAKEFEGLSIVVAGSFARLDGSEYSDVDLFFFCNKKNDDVENSKTKELRLFGDLIHLIKKLGYPDFSNDSQFLEVMYVEDKLDHLGGPEDDGANFFTARMLLLLESHCVYGEKEYEETVSTVIDRYFADYPRHPEDFAPTFLLNDISRYWKTLLLNYENKRGLPEEGEKEYQSKKNKHSIRNFKLKFSRLTTCFATICAVAAISADDLDPELIKELVNETPRQRLNIVREKVIESEALINKLFEDYAWFLSLTELSTENLEKIFSDTGNKVEHFERANSYRERMYELVELVSKKTDGNKLLSLLVM